MPSLSYLSRLPGGKKVLENMKERKRHVFMQRQDVKGRKSIQGCGQQDAAPPRRALQQSFSGNLSHYFTALSVYFVGTK